MKILGKLSRDTLDRRPSHRQTGDEARDAQDWSAAEVAYYAHLESDADDGPIWVQYGHSLKEQGKLVDAEVAYRRAISLDITAADTYLQLGHVLKLQQRLLEAGEAYAESISLKPTKAAHDELVWLGEQEHANRIVSQIAPEAAADIIFEVDDLLGYLTAHVTVSGIQRVQIGILSALLSDDHSASLGYAFVRSRSDTDNLWQLDADLLRTLVTYCRGQFVEHKRILEILSRLEQTAMVCSTRPGQCYLILGAFWGFNGDATRYARLKAAGVRVGVYIYDLIPISHPEYCDAHLVSDFALSLGDGLAVFDFILTISEFTAQRVRAYIEDNKLRPIPVRSVLLAHVMGDVKKDHKNIGLNSKLKKVLTREFVMIVSTIEARKNHLLLVTIWKMLVQEGIDPPDLVFVGRQGWRVNDLMEQLRETDNFNGRIHILHDLSDNELESLYHNCRFTAFPSYVEGWGLPVGESLAYGKVCIASNTSSIPEVGGDLVDYIDPYNLRAALDTFKKLILDNDYLDKRRSNIEKNFSARSWDMVAKDLLSKISDLLKSAEARWEPPVLYPGEIFYPAQARLGHRVPQNYPARPLRLILSEGWYIAEAFGVWMKNSTARIQFLTNQEPGDEVVVYLDLAGSPSHNGAFLELSMSDELAGQAKFPSTVLGATKRTPVAENKKFKARVTGYVRPDRTVDIKFSVVGLVPMASETDQRRLSVGLVALSYAPRHDSALRTDIMESLQIF